MHRRQIPGEQRLINLLEEAGDHSPPFPDLDDEPDTCGSTCWLKRFDDLSKDEQSRPLLEPARQNFVAASAPTRHWITSKLYLPLQPWQTRILALQSGSASDPIICNLEPVDLISRPGVGLRSSGTIIEYEALSYSWGYPEFTARIACNNIEVPVTQSLWSALYALRLPETTRYLWIDAFCINQHDLLEKARQVRDMLLIYEKAASVVAWLGLPLKSQRPALDALTYAWIQQTDHPQPRLRHQPVCQSILAEFQVAFDDILSRPWFRRTWVRQEVFAARKLSLQLGSLTLPFETFVQGALYVQAQRDIPICPSKDAKALSRSLVVLAEATVDAVDGWTRAFGVLTNNILFGASDARDRVYGLIGMMFDQKDTSAYPIDYTKGVEEVYEDLFSFLISTYRNLEALHIFRDYSDKSPGIPSWAIDWRSCGVLCLPSQVAVPGSFSNPSTQWHTICSTGKLTIRGRSIARIRSDLKAMDEVSEAPMRFHPDPEAGYLHLVNPRSVNQKFNNWWSSANLQSLLPFMRKVAYEPVGFDFVLPRGYEISECRTPGWPRMYTGFKGRHVTGTGGVDVVGGASEAADVPIEFVMIASITVTRGDLIVKLDGLQRFACIRRLSPATDEYAFLGPIMLIMRNPLFFGVATHMTNNLACMELRSRHFPDKDLSEETFLLV